MLLAFATLASAAFIFPGTSSATEEAVIKFDSASSVSLLESAHNLDAEWKSGDNCARLAVTGDGTDPYVNLKVASKLSLSADEFKYVLVTYRVPGTNVVTGTNTEMFMCAGNVTAPTAGCSATFTPVTGYKYTTEIIDMTGVSYWSGKIHSIRIDTAVNGAVWDAFYLSSVSFCKTSADAVLTAQTRTDEANAVVLSYSEIQLASNNYRLDTYVQNEYWRGKVVFNESVYPLLNADGTMSPISLMYDVDRVISVRNGTLDMEYKYGTDYIIEDGKLVILTTGSIKTVKYSDFRISSTPADTTFWQECRAGGYTYFCEGAVFHSAQLAITYTHSDIWEGPIPESKISLLPNTASKIQNKEHLTVVFSGDSITCGANVSGFVSASPSMPLWSDLTISALKEYYGLTDVGYANTAVGGTFSEWGAENAYENISKYGPDLVFIGFGMNDGTINVSPDTFKSNIQTMINSARAVNPNCEFILIAPMLANPETYFSGIQSRYLSTLESLEGSGIAVVDMTSIHSYLLGIKKYSDMTGNNVNHPNDFLARFYAQAMVAALTPSKLDEIKAEAVSSLDSIVDYTLYKDAQKEEIIELIAKYKSEIASATNESEVTALIAAAKAEISNVKTINDFALEELDYTRIVFSSEVPLGTVKGKNNVTLSYDDANSAALLKVTGDDPWICISYPDGEVSADTYKYAVLIYRVPSTVTSTATTQVFFTAGSAVGESEANSVSFAPSKGTYAYRIFDFSSYSDWKGDVHGIRIDPFAAAATGDTFYISEFAMFKDADSAAAYAYETVGSYTGTYMGDNISEYFDSSSDTSLVSSDKAVYKRGDINSDGKINARDLTILRMYIAGKIYNSDYVYDVTGDGNVNSLDAMNLKMILGGIVSSSGTYGIEFSKVTYDMQYNKVKLESAGKGLLSADICLSQLSASADKYKYVTLTYLVPSTVSFETSDVTVTPILDGNTVSEASSVFTVTPSDTFASVTLDLTVNKYFIGNIDGVKLTFSATAVSGDFIVFDSIVLSSTAKAAERANNGNLVAVLRETGRFTPVTGQNVIPFNTGTTMATYSYYNGVGTSYYNYPTELIINFDRQPEKKFDRFTLNYYASTMTRGVITYLVEGYNIEDEFYLEATSSS